MKKIIHTSSLLLLLGLLGACSVDKKPMDEPAKIEAPADQTEAQQPSAPDVEQEALTQQEVLVAIADQLEPTSEIVLPSHLPVQQGKHLTAKTNEQSNVCEITFYSTDVPTPINHASLNEETSSVEKLAVLKVKRYSTEQIADQQIAFEDYASVGGEPVDLGYSITGYQDAGVGQLWTSWNEGRWALATHTYTDQPELGVELARETVKYLETHALPIPKQHGLIHLNATGDNQYALWAKGKVVYELSDVSSPEDLLEIAVSFRKTE